MDTQLVSEAPFAPPSPRLFRPTSGRLLPMAGGVPRTDVPLDELNRQLRETVLHPDYPCIAALRAVSRDEYLVGVYGTLGNGGYWQSLRQDLLHFLSDLARDPSPYRTMFALFPGTLPMAESAFERALWAELSCVTSVETRAEDWGEHAASSDPDQQGFLFSLAGEPLFIVGVHPNSARKSRRFPFTALVFNAFSQFEHFERLGTYDRMVKINREHSVAFDGSVNPMVEQHGGTWEAIQFSGQQNPESWKCPFRLLWDKEKT